jgi:uncharacterized membrane protein YtjA (UPF0391 family)
MLYWGLVFFIIALTAGGLWFWGDRRRGERYGANFIFLVIFLATLVLGLMQR